MKLSVPLGWPWHRLALVRWQAALARHRYAVQLLAERRIWLFAGADAVLLILAFLAASLAGGDAGRIYLQVVLLPYLVLLLPLLAGVVAVERNVGSLDLALATPSTARYFVRRLLPVSAFFILQGWIALNLLVPDIGAGRRLAAMVLSAEVALLIAAIALFWAVRLTTTGAVLVASLLTVFGLGRWVFFQPFADPAHLGSPAIFGGLSLDFLIWLWHVAVLATATSIFYLYARRRLATPESMLG